MLDRQLNVIFFLLLAASIVLTYKSVDGDDRDIKVLVLRAEGNVKKRAYNLAQRAGALSSYLASNAILFSFQRKIGLPL